MKCDVSSCFSDAKVLVRFAGRSREWAYCSFHFRHGQFFCPACGGTGALKVDTAGLRAKCPACNATGTTVLSSRPAE